MSITRGTAVRHEGLMLRLAALSGAVAATAARHPELELSVEVRTAAESLLFESRAFLRALGRLPPVAPTYAALATQLAELGARLEAFELRHTKWDLHLKCRVWRIAGGESVPVERRNPKPAAPPPKTEQEKRRSKEMALEVVRRIDNRYDQGYEDALANKPREHRRGRFYPDGTARPWW